MDCGDSTKGTSFGAFCSLRKDSGRMKHSRGNKFADIFYMIRRILGILVVCAVVLVIVVMGAFFVVTKTGESSLRKAVDGQAPSLTMDDAEMKDNTGLTDTANAAPESEKPVIWKEGWVRYEGKIYEYNDDILTILLLGIDKEGKVSKNKTTTDGGQADAIFLAVANPDTGKVSLIGVNRDTIVDVLMVGAGKNGEDIPYPAQIAVQHGFGDGMQGSCELTKERVSELFYELPIHAYVSFNMGGIAKLNDALGGVEVTVLEDMTKKNKTWAKGARVKLKGKDAYTYVKWRDTSIFESARGRLGRQKQYIDEFTRQAIAAVRKDVTMPVTLYNSFKDYIVTDLSMDEIAYLAKELSGYRFEGDIYTLEGDTELRGNHEAFYPDEKALKALILKVFYREVSP